MCICVCMCACVCVCVCVCMCMCRDHVCMCVRVTRFEFLKKRTLQGRGGMGCGGLDGWVVYSAMA